MRPAPVSASGRLQRGRTRVSAESTRTRGSASLPRMASTGPHSCECGEDRVVRLPCSLALASTGPHSCECGELATSSGTKPDAGLQRGRTRVSAESPPAVQNQKLTCQLQRGRTRVSAERRKPPTSPPRRRPASTGPHSCECGEALPRPPQVQHHRAASTGPHSCECGESPFVNAKGSKDSLQRGRTRVSAERPGGKLRWKKLPCFNGAALV